MKNCYKKLPELKRKNPNQKIALDLISNIKILCFIKKDDVQEFFNKIKTKYTNKFKSFLNYFEKNYIISKQFGKLGFNYSKLVEKDIPEDIKFYTNNIIESFHKTLNPSYIGGTKTFSHFKTALFEILDLYKNKNEYKPRKLSITRALAYYTNNNEVNDLIKYSSLKTIKDSYKKYIKEKMSLNEEYSSEKDELLDVDNEDILYCNNNILDSFEGKSIDSSSNDENNINNFINDDENNNDGDNNSENKRGDKDNDNLEEVNNINNNESKIYDNKNNNNNNYNSNKCLNETTNDYERLNFINNQYPNVIEVNKHLDNGILESNDRMKYNILIDNCIY